MSIIKHKNQRVGVFIDAQNLYHSARALYGSTVNFENILKDAVLDRQLIRALAYVIVTEEGEEKSFFEALTKLGIETREKDLQIFSGGAKKGDWDVGIAIDMISMAQRLDALVLISGDGDFVPLVNYLKTTFGVQVEVVSFKASSSVRLQEVADDFIDLGMDPKKYVIYKKRHQRKTNRNNLSMSGSAKGGVKISPAIKKKK